MHLHKKENIMEIIKRLKQQPKQGGVPQVSGTGAFAQAVNQATFTFQQAQELANQIIAEQQAQAQLASNGRVYTKFDMQGDIVKNQTEVVTAGMWSDNIASLTTYATASGQTDAQRRYYVDVYQENPANEGAAVQFSLAYGHALGSGSDSQGQLEDSPTRAVYSQYKQLLLEKTATRFQTTNSGSTDSIYALNFKRNRMRERLDPGNFELPLIAISSRDVNATGSVATGSAIYTLIDDSSANSATVGESGRVYNIVSGSINAGIYNSAAPEYYGKVYPDYGVLVLDGNVLDQKLGFATNVSSSVEGNNHFGIKCHTTWEGPQNKPR
jgi:hypothetical protein